MREGRDKHCTEEITPGQGPNEKKDGRKKRGAIFMLSFKRKLKDFVYAIEGLRARYHY